jgi:protein-S-isoprenylcysteine O-methyltransferase
LEGAALSAPKIWDTTARVPPRILSANLSSDMMLRVKLPDPMWLGLLYAGSELWLGITRRSGPNAISHEKKSLRILWIVILASVFFGIKAASWFPSAAMPHRHSLRIVGFFIFVFGLVLRWYSIGYLGKFFTIDVAIHSEHRVIKSGPYRYIRHPSYTGALLAFLGLGLSIGNWCSIAIFILPTFLAFLVRIKVEEGALAEAMGEQYRSYQKRTHRLVPFVY